MTTKRLESLVYRFQATLTLCVISIALLTPAARADIWIKEQSDRSNWPSGFAIPQPPPGQNPISVNGAGWDGYDTPLDACMRANAGAWVSVWIGPGTFNTRGIYTDGYSQSTAPGWRLQDHGELHGAGMSGSSATVLRLVAYNPQWGAVVVGSNRAANGSNISLTDLQIDCNAPGLVGGDYSHPWNLQGAEIWGAGSIHIRNVLVRNSVGFHPTEECFILVVAASSLTSTDNTIENCIVQEFYNPNGLGKCSAISLNRKPLPSGTISGTVYECTVSLNGFLRRNTGEFAYNCHSGLNCTYTNNTSYGANRGFNADSTDETSLTFFANTFDIPPDNWDTVPGNFGMYLIHGIRWSRIHDNTFNLWGAQSDGIMVSGPSPAGNGGSRLMLDHNHFYKVGSWSGTSYGLDLNDSSDPHMFTFHHRFTSKAIRWTTACRTESQAQWDTHTRTQATPSRTGLFQTWAGNIHRCELTLTSMVTSTSFCRIPVRMLRSGISVLAPIIHNRMSTH